MDPRDPQDFGFTFRLCSNGDVQIFHRGRLASTLRGRDADKFTQRVRDERDVEAQQYMARLTGNYKRGNERGASQHPRNGR